MPLNLRLSFVLIPSPPSPSIHLPKSLRFPSQFSLTPSIRRRRRHCPRASCSNSDDFSDELDRLLVLLPQEMRRSLETHPDLLRLIEIVMDLGRPPLARFPAGDFLLSDRPIASQDLHHATSQIGDFAGDNRAGISRTLHRISAIRNRKGGIVGLTCRVGRAVPGSANMLRDLVMVGGSLLLIGPPGVGKTTIIRDIARMLADDYKKRVMIVDTSNEIGGDGDIPHAGIGSARRMQVPNFDVQHKVLIEAVENHMPQVIVIDEIGTKLEAMAASTIAQRGIQLVASAHGVTIENLIMNPSLEMLVGGIQSVTLGDEEASRRGVQKTVLERKGPSTFTCGAEIISKSELQVHHNLEATVDALLAGRSPNFEVRKIDPKSSTFETLHVQMESSNEVDAYLEDDVAVEEDTLNYDEMTTDNTFNLEFADKVAERSSEAVADIHLFVYGIAETSVLQAIKRLGMDEAIGLTDNISEADAFLALHSKLKKNSQIQAVAKSRGIPIHITKTSSVMQITKAICALTTEHLKASKESEAEDKLCSSEKMGASETSSMMHIAKANNSSTAEHAKRFKELEANDKVRSLEETDALEEVRLAIEQVVIPEGEQVQLLPRSSHILSIQIELIERYKLKWEKIGRDPYVSLRVYSLPLDSKERKSSNQSVDAASELQDLPSSDGTNSSQNGVARLPLLPE